MSAPQPQRIEAVKGRPLKDSQRATLVYKSRPVSSLPPEAQAMVRHLWDTYQWGAPHMTADGELASIEVISVCTHHKRAVERATREGYQYTQVPVDEFLPDATVQYGETGAPASPLNRDYLMRDWKSITREEAERLERATERIEMAVDTDPVN